MKYIKWVRIDKIKVVKVGKNTQAKYMLVYLGRVPWTKAKFCTLPGTRPCTQLVYWQRAL